ncbi:protein Shroom2-like [Manis pentadactyla]|uniref:protein Shroom2-like n=1 Tax=Manis pentadactyla TaxID=143292 RepID=UPI00255CDBF0|nr:protein Shroom2-like [Manis pentadactyla]
MAELTCLAAECQYRTASCVTGSVVQAYREASAELRWQAEGPGEHREHSAFQAEEGRRTPSVVPKPDAISHIPGVGSRARFELHTTARRSHPRMVTPSDAIVVVFVLKMAAVFPVQGAQPSHESAETGNNTGAAERPGLWARGDLEVGGSSAGRAEGLCAKEPAVPKMWRQQAERAGSEAQLADKGKQRESGMVWTGRCPLCPGPQAPSTPLALNTRGQDPRPGSPTLLSKRPAPRRLPPRTREPGQCWGPAGPVPAVTHPGAPSRPLPALASGTLQGCADQLSLSLSPCASAEPSGIQPADGPEAAAEPNGHHVDEPATCPKRETRLPSKFQPLQTSAMETSRSPSPQFAPQKLTDKPPLLIQDDSPTSHRAEDGVRLHSENLPKAGYEEQIAVPSRSPRRRKHAGPNVTSQQPLPTFLGVK